MKVSCSALVCCVGFLLAGAQVTHAQLAPPVPDPSLAIASDSIAEEPVSLDPGDAFSSEYQGSSEPKCVPPHVGRDFLICKDRCSGLLAGAELLYIKPYASESALDNGPGGSQMNFNPSMRYWLGWQNIEGLGLRARYWDFDRSTSSALPDSFGVEYRTIDIEMTKAIDFRSCNLLFSGGMRYAETAINQEIFGFAADGGFDGFGLTFATQGAYNLNRSGSLRLAAGGRFSSVFGNTKSVNFAFVNSDDLVNIVELNLGPQYRRQLTGGAYLTLGAGFETQSWSNGNPLAIDTQDFGFAGFTTSIAITR